MMLHYFPLWIPPGGWCHSLQVLWQRLQGVTSPCPQIPQCSTHSLRKGGTTWLLSSNVPWPLCASSGTGVVTQCFDIYCPMRVPNSKFSMVRLNDLSDWCRPVPSIQIVNTMLTKNLACGGQPATILLKFDRQVSLGMHHRWVKDHNATQKGL